MASLSMHALGKTTAKHRTRAAARTVPLSTPYDSHKNKENHKNPHTKHRIYEKHNLYVRNERRKKDYKTTIRPKPINTNRNRNKTEFVGLPTPKETKINRADKPSIKAQIKTQIEAQVSKQTAAYTDNEKKIMHNAVEQACTQALDEIIQHARKKAIDIAIKTTRNRNSNQQCTCANCQSHSGQSTSTASAGPTTTVIFCNIPNCSNCKNGT